MERRRRYLRDLAPRLSGMTKSGLGKPPLLPVPPELCCRLEALDDSELMSARSPDVTELLPVRHGEMSLSNTWQSTTGSSLSWKHPQNTQSPSFLLLFIPSRKIQVEVCHACSFC